jgi:hypothetical protein
MSVGGPCARIPGNASGGTERSRVQTARRTSLPPYSQHKDDPQRSRLTGPNDLHLATAKPVTWSLPIMMAMLALRGYLVIAALLLLIKAIQLGTG